MRKKGDRSTPVWVPNPIDGTVLFLLEALIMFTLALATLGVAVVALWIF
ncbi:MAG: hypothetical protein BMS9Abin20_1055 [Acidimicrobiia bacterium]|nr:MAG: hypothetical protein BMS9Abin20_1055 [Acidimicrobiia bacterium]